jgi:hypothetical protein
MGIMRIELLIERLQKLQELCPNADVYFTADHGNYSCEIELLTFNVDDENNNIEMLFDAEEE